MESPANNVCVLPLLAMVVELDNADFEKVLGNLGNHDLSSVIIIMPLAFAAHRPIMPSLSCCT